MYTCIHARMHTCTHQDWRHRCALWVVHIPAASMYTYMCVYRHAHTHAHRTCTWTYSIHWRWISNVQMYVVARKHFGQGGSRRIIHTLVPLVFRSIQLALAIKKVCSACAVCSMLVIVYVLLVVNYLQSARYRMYAICSRQSVVWYLLYVCYLSFPTYSFYFGYPQSPACPC
jgi:hypothetical protein